MTETAAPPAASIKVVLLPSHRFFARRIPLATGGVAAQAELALEGFSPFPVEQLYHGYVASPAQDEALVYAAYRKQFTADETTGWTEALLVLPAWVALLETAPTAPVIRLWQNADSLVVAAWDGRSSLPAVVISRAAAETTDGAALVAEARARSGLAEAAVEEFSGEAAGLLRADGRGCDFAINTIAGERRATLGKNDTATADVRDKGFLQEQRRVGQRDQWLWRAFLSCVIGCAALLVTEAGLAGAGWALRGLQTKNQLQAGPVEKIMREQALSERIEELGGRRLMPLEMLGVLNRSRPASVNFLRVTTTDQLALEIEAQTANASDVSIYETALRAAPEIAAVETKDLHSRDGATSFLLVVTFKAGALPAGGGR